MVEGTLEGLRLDLALAFSPARFEGLEGEVAELIQVAEGVQALADLFADLGPTAGADLQAAKARVTDGNIGAQIAQPVAVRAVGVAEEISARCGRRARL